MGGRSSSLKLTLTVNIRFKPVSSTDFHDRTNLNTQMWRGRVSSVHRCEVVSGSFSRGYVREEVYKFWNFLEILTQITRRVCCNGKELKYPLYYSDSHTMPFPPIFALVAEVPYSLALLFIGVLTCTLKVIFRTLKRAVLGNLAVIAYWEISVL